jgi:hypothetical protein
MPEHKRQHYVPRCYLKPFTLNTAGVAIDVFNISRQRAIRHAPIRGQCAKDYFYGEDLTLERSLQRIEGEYARAIRALQDGREVPTTGDLELLRNFAYLQYARTDMAMQRRRMIEEGLHRTIHEGRPIEAPDLDLSDRTIMRDSMHMYARTCDQIDDLKVCILKNESDTDFITSDDPSIFTSRFYLQRLGSQHFGLSSSGALFLLPLSPRLLLICYDGNVYTIPDKEGCFVTTERATDVVALNEFQYLKASKNLYFSKWDDRDRIAQEFQQIIPQRPKSWCEFFVFVLDKSSDQGEHYRRATKEERVTARETLVSMHVLHPSPSNWLSKLKYRSAIRTYSNGSAVGHVRQKIWLERNPALNAGLHQYGRAKSPRGK